MHISVGNKFILGFVVVVAAVAFSPRLVHNLGYEPEVTVVLGYVVGITVGLVLGWLFTRSFSRRIGGISESAENISAGDLTQDLDLPAGRFHDELHELATAINDMVVNLRELVRHIRETSGKVTDSAQALSITTLEINASTEEIAQTIEQISRGAEMQAEMVTKCSTNIHDMAMSVGIVAGSAREAAQAARETSATAQQGMDLANDSLERIGLFFDTQEQAGQQFASLNGKLQQVGKIVDVIGEIARQTNMLALNASIESVRAGEFGKGFAVVAEEVRKLADNTARSVGEIADLITTIREESRMMQFSFVQSGSHISEGKKNVNTTVAAFRQIMATVVETERKADSIAELAQLQTAGAGQVVQAIDEIAKVTDENAAATEQVSAATQQQSAAMQDMANASKELALLAADLLQTVERFRIAAPAESAAHDVTP
jgi:methyl-accepting chemotaxis protein